MANGIHFRVESGLDDPDNLGHFFGGSGGSHPQTTLSGCDLDITCSLENIVGIWKVSELFSLMNVLKYHWSEASLKHVVFKDFIFKKSVQGNWFSMLPRRKKSMALFHIKIFSCHVTLLLKKLQHVGHIRIVQWVK